MALLAALALALRAWSADLEMHVIGVEQPAGNLAVALFAAAGAKGFPDAEPLRKLQVPVREAGEIVVRIPELSQGRYALALFHDENANGALDKNFLGIPREPIGFSNDPTIYFGAPGFGRCSFELEESGGKQVIHLKRL